MLSQSSRSSGETPSNIWGITPLYLMILSGLCVIALSPETICSFSCLGSLSYTRWNASLDGLPSLAPEISSNTLRIRVTKSLYLSTDIISTSPFYVFAYAHGLLYNIFVQKSNLCNLITYLNINKKKQDLFLPLLIYFIQLIFIF